MSLTLAHLFSPSAPRRALRTCIVAAANEVPPASAPQLFPVLCCALSGQTPACALASLRAPCTDGGSFSIPTPQVDLGPAGVEACVREAGVGFMFAPRYHPAMKVREAVAERGSCGRGVVAALHHRIRCSSKLLRVIAAEHGNTASGCSEESSRGVAEQRQLTFSSPAPLPFVPPRLSRSTSPPCARRSACARPSTSSARS